MADLSFIEDAVAFPEKEEDEEEEEEGVEWGYEEGVEWGLVFPDANGEYQSPINLNSREARYDPSLLDVRLSPNYVVCRDCEVTNDGHTIQVILKSKSVLSGGPLPQGQEFELYEVRFHWGRENQRGSEHTVNFKAFPMELHLIHWNSTLFGSIDEAVGKPHGIAIIALFVQIGKEHVGLKAVTEILQDIQYKGKSKTIPCFNPNTLLPDPLLRDYWVYEGSLTIPPCSEGVTWILFRYPLTISQMQEEDSGPTESFDEWNLLSGSFVLTLKPALSSVITVLMDICDQCLYTCCHEILEVAVHCKENQCVCTHHSFWNSYFCTYCFLLMCRKNESSFQLINMTVSYINMR
ncbi:carbonic anhydrase-related protein isoform X2 [Apodemus sylvaticus]|uniref:carbonic anhydrase-related protein isoform X2 n=1 Tax=Apodemus sylvaticus TaxID=10129 RepID=UPI002244C7AE|nr:carbonic anhydrase-related protein isoform X2 [Apodemus sylvaticus]